MKKLLNLNINISIWTFLVWLILICLDAVGLVFFCYGMMMVHEMGHVIAGVMMNCRVNKIMIYPFGFCAEMQGIQNLSYFQRLILYSAGPLMHGFILFGFVLLNKMNLISIVMLEYLCQINMNYFLFNLFPVFPLDGYHLLYESLWMISEKTADHLSFCVSLFSCLFLWGIQPDSIVYRMICVFLGVLSIKHYQERNEMRIHRKVWMERKNTETSVKHKSFS